MFRAMNISLLFVLLSCHVLLPVVLELGLLLLPVVIISCHVLLPVVILPQKGMQW